MTVKYVLDACALLAFIYRENGFHIVKSILEKAEADEVEVYMNKLNLFEPTSSTLNKKFTDLNDKSLPRQN